SEERRVVLRAAVPRRAALVQEPSGTELVEHPEPERSGQLPAPAGRQGRQCLIGEALGHLLGRVAPQVAVRAYGGGQTLALRGLVLGVPHHLGVSACQAGSLEQVTSRHWSLGLFGAHGGLSPSLF